MSDRIHVFGQNNEWAIGEDDGCLRFYPQYNIDKKGTTKWIWREAWEEVEKLGGFKKVVKMLRGEEI